MIAGEASAVILCGVVAISLEFLRPGRVLPAIAGLILTAWGVRDLRCWPVSNIGLSLIALSLCLFAAEAFWCIDFLASIAGASCLAVGFCRLAKPPASIPWVATVPASLLFGAWAGLLLNTAKRARRNKHADLVSED